MKEFPQELLKHTSIILILIGAILFLLGVAGGIATNFFSLPITGTISRFVTALVGFSLVSAGVYLVWRDERQKSEKSMESFSESKRQTSNEQMTWDEVWDKLNQLAIEIRHEPFNPDMIIGLARAGSLVASLFAINFRYKPFLALDRDPTTGDNRQSGEVNFLDALQTEYIKKKVILLIDSECTSGQSLQAAKDFLLHNKHAKEVRTMVIGLNESSKFRPDYVGFQYQKGPIWPWIYTDVSKHHQKIWRKGYEKIE